MTGSDSSYRQDAKIDPDTPLELATDGKKLDVIPVRNPKRQKELEKALREIDRKYGRMLKRLAE